MGEFDIGDTISFCSEKGKKLKWFVDNINLRTVNEFRMTHDIKHTRRVLIEKHRGKRDCI